jgi:hypothetical protein
MNIQTATPTHEQKPTTTPSTSGLPQRKCACGNHTMSGDECTQCRSVNEALQRASLSPNGREMGSRDIPPVVHEVLRSSGQPLNPATRAFMEPRFGYDFSLVRVHSDAKAAESARAVGALAYTAGRDIVFGGRNFDTDSRRGRELIAHELAHVVQQGGQPPSQLQNLVMTHPGDATEREAHDAALAVVGGKPYPAPTHTGVALARQSDAGVPADAGPSSGRPDAGPIAGVPGPSPVPAPTLVRTPAPAPAPAAPAAIIGAVTFRGSANRIAPTRTATVPVTLSGLPAGRSATIGVEGSGGANGTATITAGATLASSGAVTVRGDTQTTPGNAGKLRLRATVGGKVVGRSPGFTVAAWPADFTISRNADIDTSLAVGLAVNIACVSDGGGALAELSEAEHTERVDIDHRDNPPFTTPGAVSASGTGTSGFMAATTSSLVDSHARARAIIDTHTLATGVYTQVFRQNFLFNDRRTGIRGAVVQNSGFTITHSVLVLDFPFLGRSSSHQTVKRGAAVTVEGKATTAGSGTATSDTHTL